MNTAGSKEPRVFAITDCGSTTTKAILVEKRDGVFRAVHKSQAPTTVEAPFDDIFIGIRRAMSDLESSSGRRLLDDRENLIRPGSEGSGVDAYLSTSSAGGGLQMVVLGLSSALSARSARAAALGAGAIVVDTIAFEDRLCPHERIEKLRASRPDIVLLAGGTDRGAETQVLELAEMLAAAAPAPRLGPSERLPVLFAGNTALRRAISRTLEDRFDVFHVDNVLPDADRESLVAARARIQEIFLQHVMRRAPGFGALAETVDSPVLPTPLAVGRILTEASRRLGRDITCVDIGGATTDIFTVSERRMERSVSADLGMSYCAANVLREATPEGIARWMTDAPPTRFLQNEILGKAVRPTTLPVTALELSLEHALAKEAIRLAYAGHREFVETSERARSGPALGRAFAQTNEKDNAPGLLIGSGGVLSHAPRPEQTAAMLIDAFLPTGVTELARDNFFILPHLGALLEVSPQAAMDVFERDCWAPLGACVAPSGSAKTGKPILELELVRGATRIAAELRAGQLFRIQFPGRGPVRLRLSPVRGFDVGAGPGRRLEQSVDPGAVGIVLDGRGRPDLAWPADPNRRREAAALWQRAWRTDKSGGAP